jgi:hypothetical protein
VAAAPSYAFDNDDPEAADRHDYLAEILDGLTVQRLSGLGDLTGRRCLEVGAGAGSIARRLARAAGPAGRVLATDINTRYLGPGTDFQVLRHDLSTEPVPEGPWDVIHARMVLLHLPRRREILHRLAAGHGNDPTWAGQVHAAMLAEGLTGLDTVVHARSWPGGTAGALLIGANIAQARADFLAAGMTGAELDELQRLVTDPRLVVRGPLTYSTIGRR